MLDFEDLDMIATCKRLSARLTAAENAFVTSLDGRTNPISRATYRSLRALWDNVTTNGTVDTRP